MILGDMAGVESIHRDIASRRLTFHRTCQTVTASWPGTSGSSGTSSPASATSLITSLTSSMNGIGRTHLTVMVDSKAESPTWAVMKLTYQAAPPTSPSAVEDQWAPQVPSRSWGQ